MHVAESSAQAALGRPSSPCCSAPVTNQSEPKLDEVTVYQFTPGTGAIETEREVRVQGGLCSDCGNELVRYAQPDGTWDKWSREDL